MGLTTDITTWRVLIVDDEPDNLNLASDFLEFSGAVTAKALDGRSGLKTLETFQPNLILLDLDMPTMDGWEMHHQLRLKPELANVPIIALTALAMPSDEQRVHDAGFDGYITKPFRVKVLLDALNTYIAAFSGTNTTSS
jgi:CheY-like chemotaxis protein